MVLLTKLGGKIVNVPAAVEHRGAFGDGMRIRGKIVLSRMHRYASGPQTAHGVKHVIYALLQIAQVFKGTTRPKKVKAGKVLGNVVHVHEAKGNVAGKGFRIAYAHLVEVGKWVGVLTRELPALLVGLFRGKVGGKYLTATGGKPSGNGFLTYGKAKPLFARLYYAGLLECLRDVYPFPKLAVVSGVVAWPTHFELGKSCLKGYALHLGSGCQLAGNAEEGRLTGRRFEKLSDTVEHKPKDIF
jgi:hypothetical protein